MPTSKRTAWRRSTDLLIEYCRENTGKLPGERELAEKWGMSRGSVREGLRVVEAFGALEVHVGSGENAGAQPSGDLQNPLSLLLSLHHSTGTLSDEQIRQVGRDMDALVLTYCFAAPDADKNSSASRLAVDLDLQRSGVLDEEELVDSFRSARVSVWKLCDNPLLVSLSHALFEERWRARLADFRSAGEGEAAGMAKLPLTQYVGAFSLLHSELGVAASVERPGPAMWLMSSEGPLTVADLVANLP